MHFFRVYYSTCAIKRPFLPHSIFGKVKGLAMPDEFFVCNSKVNIGSLPSIDERSLSEYSFGTSVWSSCDVCGNPYF